MEFSGRGISEDGTLTTDPGESYAFGLTMGAQETSQSMRIHPKVSPIQGKREDPIASSGGDSK